jgi:phosphoserine phosphatase
MDALIQAPGLPSAAIEAFAVALLARETRRRPGAARLYGVVDDAATRKVTAALATFWKCDANLVRPDLRTADFRVLAMDMDSTAITVEGIDELAALAGKGPQVAEITAAAMRGEIPDYSDSLRRRVALLAGSDAALLERVLRERVRISPGARELVAAARALGWRTLLVSGGFDAIATPVGAELGVDAVCANHLVVEDGRLTGEVVGPAEDEGAIVDAPAKARTLQRLCAALEPPARPLAAVAIGDGANDLGMMAIAGLSVAYRAKPAVRERATCALDHAPLDAILNLFADRW